MQDQTIPFVKLKLYHATYSKKNFENILPFLKYGALPDISEGYGQGKGFYVWTTREMALGQAEFQKERHLDYSGYPVLVAVEEVLEPKYWDLSYESNAKLIIAFLRGNWGLFKLIPDRAIRIDDDLLIVSKSKKSFFPYTNIIFEFENVNGWNHSYSTQYLSRKFPPDPDTHEAKILGAIFNYIQEHFSKPAYKFEEAIFLKLVKKGLALKYVGEKPLKIKDLEIKVEGRWIKGKEAKRFIQGFV